MSQGSRVRQEPPELPALRDQESVTLALRGFLGQLESLGRPDLPGTSGILESPGLQDQPEILALQAPPEQLARQA